MLKKIRIHIVSRAWESGRQLFAPNADTAAKNSPRAAEKEIQKEDLFLDAAWLDDGKRVTVSYREPAAAEMGESSTTLSFSKDDPATVTMNRYGDAQTFLLFRAGARHETLYKTPLCSFDLCMETERVENRLDGEGVLELVYTAQLRGADALNHHFKLTI